MNLNKLSPRLVSGIFIALFFGVALFIRAYLPYDAVFGGEWLKFTSPDAYYHMRLVDNLVNHFPNRILFDPYVNFPQGKFLDISPFFHWFMGGIIWLIGLGSPTQHTVDMVGVYFPAVLGALTVIPVYFIGKELFGRWAGIISAGLLAILPGEFLGRSILGFTDHHVAEVLFTTTSIMFLILAIKTSRERQLTFSHLWHRDWTTISRPMIYSLLAGIFLGIYLISWLGALLFVFIIAIYFIIQFIIDHLRRNSTDYLCLIGVIPFIVTLIIYATVYTPVIHRTPSLISLGIALLIPIVLSIVSRQMANRGIRPAYYPIALLGLAGIGLVIFRFSFPSQWTLMWTGFDIFNPSGPITIIEMQPLLSPQGSFTTLLAWHMFATSFYISLISIGLLIYIVTKRDDTAISILVVWSLIILAATLGQRRFAYYFAVNVALLTGYLSWLVLRFVSLLTDYLSTRKEFDTFKGVMVKLLETQRIEEPLVETQQVEIQQVETRKARKKKKARPKRKYEGEVNPTIRYINMSVAVIVIFFLVFFPNIRQAVTVAQQPQFAPSDAWCSSLNWLGENTPEPFGDPGYYYQRYERPLSLERYQYPESARAITAWGDYGYWILRIAHRLPNITPGPGGGSVARFFLSQDESSAEEMARNLKSSYVVIDRMTTVDKFYAIAEWAGLKRSQFYDYYFIPQEGDKLVRIPLFYPEYYSSLVVRLYNFDGQAVTPEDSKVISYENLTLPDGETARVVTDVQSFPSYEEAVAYISNQESENYRIVNDNPFSSPVPLTAVENYRLIHNSDEQTVISGIGVTIPEVKIFEYMGAD